MKRIKKNIYDATKFWCEENEKNLSMTEVGKLFQVDRHTFSKLTYKDIYKEAFLPFSDADYYCYFPEVELQMLREYFSTNISKNALCKKYNYASPNTVLGWIRALQIKDKEATRFRKYDFNRNTFKRIDTEEKAYWLGFLLADGCIIENSNKGKNSNNKIYKNITLRLGDKDKEHVFKFARFLGYNESDLSSVIKPCYGGAYDRHNLCWVIDVCDTEMCNDLEKYNIFPRKSLRETPYHFEEENLILSYIRGIIDGDGWISRYDRKNKRLGVVGSQDTCDYIADIMNSYYDFHMKKSKPKAHSEKINADLYYWQTTSKQSTIEAIKLLYPENATIYLDRKYKNARAVLKSLN